FFFFFFSSRRRHTRSYGDWSSDVCSSDLHRLADDRAADFVDVAIDEIRPLLIALRGIHHSTAQELLVEGAGHLGDENRIVVILRSEERRVGKEGRCGWGRDELKKMEHIDE